MAAASHSVDVTTLDNILGFTSRLACEAESVTSFLLFETPFLVPAIIIFTSFSLVSHVCNLL